MSLDRYKVFNLIEDVLGLKVLMILESPHTNEYIHGHPAAGESALVLTQFLKAQGYLQNFDAQLPVGCNIKTLHYKPLGILNCSTLLMNKAFYPCTLVAEELAQVNQLVSIKQSLAQNSLETDEQKQIKLANTAIFKDFANRLTQVLARAISEVIIVPCGDTAIGFISAFKADYNKPLTVLDALPHPTELAWRDKISTINLIDHIPPQLLP